MSIGILTSKSATSPTAPVERTRARPARHSRRWVGSAFVVLIAVSVLDSVATNPRFEWGTVGQYLTDPSIIRGGVAHTIEITALAMALGIALGIILAVMRLSPVPVVSGAAWYYIWFFRGTPVLVQLIFWYNLAALYPHITVGIPFTSAVLWSGSANNVITQFSAAVLGFALNEAAYMAEIVRAGILSVDEGQTEAAQSLGMTRLMTIRRIVLPQAIA